MSRETCAVCRFPIKNPRDSGEHLGVYFLCDRCLMALFDMVRKALGFEADTLEGK